MNNEKSCEDSREENPLLHEVVVDGNAKEGHEKRIARYSQAKARQVQVIDYILQQNQGSHNPLYTKEQEALEKCGSFFQFRHYFEISKYVMTAGCTCKKHLLCSLCAIRRSAKYIASYAEKIKTVTEGMPYDVLFITLTVKNGFELLERYDHIQEALAKLLQRRKNALKKNPTANTLFKHVFGAVYTFEVTYNEVHGYHPHLHMIALVPQGTFKFTEQIRKKKTVQIPLELEDDLLIDWYRITKDSYIIDVRKVENDKEQLEALAEQFKYALKFSDMAVETQLACYEVLRSRKMVNAIGALRGVKEPINLNDELQPGELKYVELLYQYSGLKYGYQLIEHSAVKIQKESLKRKPARKQRKKNPDGPETKFSIQVDDYQKKAAFYGTIDAIKEKVREKMELIERTGKEPVPF